MAGGYHDAATDTTMCRLEIHFFGPAQTNVDDRSTSAVQAACQRCG